MKRIRIGSLAAVCLVVFVTLSFVPGVNLLSAETSAAPPPTCYNPTYTIHIFEGKARIYNANLNQYYSDGQTVAITICRRTTVVALQAVMNDNSFAPFEWMARTGYFQNTGTNWSMANPVNFLPPWGTNAFQGYLNLVTRTVTADIWSGYENSGHMTQAFGDFILPTVSYAESGFRTQPDGCTNLPMDNYDLVSLWVGIGGVNGNAYLWQAGVDIFRSATATYYISWWEAYPYNLPVPKCDVRPSAGDHIQVNVLSSGPAGNHYNWGYVTDVTNPSASYSFSLGGWAPDDTTAEWIMEIVWAGYGYWPIPNSGTVRFFNCFDSQHYNYDTFVYSANADFANQITSSPHQFLSPGRLDGTDWRAFSISYSQG